MNYLQRLFSVLLILGMLFGFTSSGILPANATQLAEVLENPSSKFESLVYSQLESGAADFFINLVEQADLKAANQIMTKEEKGAYVYNVLLTTATRTQADLRAYLDKQGVKYQSFYIVNTILVKMGSLQLATSIAARPEVAGISANHTFQLDEPIINQDALNQPEAVEPNISFVKANQAWAMGFSGQGTVMAGNDTGLYWSHPALIRQYRGCLNPPECTSIDHNYNWWDATGTYPNIPNDGHGHGTHTTGTMVGDDGVGNQIGMAPEARTVHCKNMTDGGSGNDGTFLTCFQWDLAPWDLNHQNPRPDLAPDAINNSWGYSGGGQNQFRGAVDALLAAGIVVEVSSGNEGPGCQSLRSPGDYQEVFTTGSINHASTWPGSISGFSSRGPSDLDGNYFPDFMAPGENIRSSVPGGSYEGGWSGTSMAGPHVTALIGLIWSANPALRGQIQTTYDIIQQTVTPLTGQTGSNCGGDYTTGPNNDWGYGTIDALAAVQLAVSYGGAGVLQGTVTDSTTGLHVSGAAINAIRQEGGSWSDLTDENGSYQVNVAAGTFDITASHPYYMNQTYNNVEVAEESTTVQNIILEPRGLLFGYVTDFDNGFALAGAIVTTDDGSSVTTDATGYYEMYLDEGVYQLTVTMQDYAPGDATVEIYSGEDWQEDFALLAAISVVPDPIHAVVTLGETGSVDTAATNNLSQEYPFQFIEVAGGKVNSGQSVTGSGGPDPFGYTFVDSNAPGGALFEWVDATNGTPLLLADDGEANVILPFSFNFYGTSASNLRIGNNGGVLFNVTSGDVSVTNGDLGSNTTNNFFAPFWDDIDSDTGDVFYKTVGTAPYRQFVVEWYNRPHYSNVGNTTFELILYETTNNIKYQYLDAVFDNASYDYGTSATIGIRQTGINYLQYSYNQPVIQNNMAICFMYPGSAPCDGGDVLWFGESLQGGTIPAEGGILNWVTTFDATEAAGIDQPGEYHAALRLQPTTGSLPAKLVPVIMTVLPTNTQGLLEGTVTSDRPGGAVVADILIESSGGMTLTLTTDANGYFQYYLEEGEYSISASSAGYLPKTAHVTIIGEQTITQDFVLVLNAANIVIDPASFEVTVELGQSTVEVMNISNHGVQSLNFEIAERNGEFLPNSVGEDILVVAHDTSAAAAMESALVTLGYTYLQVTDAGFQAMTVEQLLEYLAVFHAGTTGTTGAPGPSEVLLTAYLDAGGALFISDNDLGYFRHNYAFFDTYLQSIYDVDDGGTFVDGLGLMAGLTLDIAADPYPDGITARAEGIPIFQFQVSGAKGGVAVDRNGYHAVYTSFDFQHIADTAQEIEVIDRVLSFIVESDVPWISEDPILGSVDAGGASDISLSFNAAVVPVPGTYTVDLQIKNNDPYNSKVIVPVVMHVTPPGNIGRLEGTITGMGYCDAESYPLEAQVVIENSTGITWTITSDPATGYYFQWLPVDTYTVTASVAGHQDASAQAVVIGQQTTTLDLALRYIESCMDVSPTSFTISMIVDSQITQTLSIINNGAGELNWEIHETTATLQAQNVEPVYIGGDPFGKHAANTPGNPSGSAPLMAPQDVLVQEGFEAGIVPPTDWTLIQTNQSQTWKIQSAVVPYEGTYLADVEYDASLQQQDEVFLSPELMLQSGVLDFWSFGSLYWCRDTYDNCDLNIWIVVGEWDGGTGDDIYVGKADDDWTANWVWSNSVFDLTSLLPGVPVRIAFQYYGMDGAQVGLDAIVLDGQLGSQWTDVPWVSEVPASGVTSPDSTFEVDVVFDSTGLTPGECYDASLGLVHDDPGMNSPFFIPLNLCIILPEYGVDLEPEASGETGMPGSVVQYTLHLTNMGNVADTFEISFSNVDQGWVVDLPVSSFDLMAGDSEDVTVNVTIPVGAGNGAFDAFTLTATSVNDPLATDDVEITTTVELELFHFWLPVINKG
jgi:hypothetical protein